MHAAGNIISLKLIIEDPDIVRKINENLSRQIRVWGIERTNGSFSAYQLCDSRIYEYLIPTHCFLPPHPDSFLGKKLVELSEEAGDNEGYSHRQEEVASFWAEAEEQYIKPIIEKVDPSIRALISKALYDTEFESSIETVDSISEDTKQQENKRNPYRADRSDVNLNDAKRPKAQHALEDQQANYQESLVEDVAECKDALDEPVKEETQSTIAPTQKEPLAIDQAVKELKLAYIRAKKAYRLHPKRLERVRSTLSRYVGTHNYHNYTISKSFDNASAKRVIKTFLVGEKPIIINNTEWLSLKVHGQSFMMHQIRKMVSMAALVVRCGCHEGRLQDSYMADKISIPKAPGSGLLLERPVFDTYNSRITTEGGKEKIEFAKFEREMEEFKQREIYERIFREEERDNQ